MPAVKSKRGGKRRGGFRKRRFGGRRRVFRPARQVPEWASCTESIALTNITGLPYNMNTMYGFNATQLAYFINRAVPIAQSYQHYRIKRILMEFKPQFDTFAPLAGVPPGTSFSVPNLFYMINKSGSIPGNPTVDNLRAMGAKPIRFDEKIVKVAWRPSVLQENAGVLGDVGSGYKVSPWLSTNANANAVGVWNPSTVSHLGIYWIVQRNGTLPPGTSELPFDVQLTVEFQFKKPLVKVLSGSPQALEYAPQSLAATVNDGSRVSP